MATITGWRQRRRVAPRRAAPLRTIASGLVQIARAAFAEPYQLAVERRAVGLKRLPRELDGLKVVQLSDVHHGPLTSRAQIERAVEVANSLQPDLVALTGDYVSHERRYVQPCAEMLGRLRARRGVYAVLGNHDNWVDAALVVLPIAVKTALSLGLNPRAFAVAVTYAASCSFLTPLEPACVLIYTPGRYRFFDFVRVGSVLTLAVFAVVLLLVPVFWPLQ